MAQNIPGPTNTRDERTDRFLQVLNGCPITPAIGCITGTAATSNGSTVTPFSLNNSSMYFLQADTACYVGSGPDSATAIANVTGSGATAGGFLVDPAVYGVGFMITLRPSDTCVAMVPVTGTTNLKVLRMV